ncbi:hypothetical protein [Bacillus cereus group sp. MYBK150-2]|uniref:hypothetical protein n=1 Tax=Bacillus cereus group sp. MYBK150-2 TaxID=3450679 RepID=UPI003F798AD8
MHLTQGYVIRGARVTDRLFHYVLGYKREQFFYEKAEADFFWEKVLKSDTSMRVLEATQEFDFSTGKEVQIIKVV